MNNMEFTIAISTYFVLTACLLFFLPAVLNSIVRVRVAGNILARANMDMHDRHY